MSDIQINLKLENIESLYYVISQTDWDELAQSKKIPCHNEKELREIKESIEALKEQLQNALVDNGIISLTPNRAGMSYINQHKPNFKL